MPRKKKKVKQQILLTPTGRKKKIVVPTLSKARNLRSSLLKRITPELKSTTPSVEELHKLFRKQPLICYYTKEAISLDDVSIDHLQPLNRGGDNSMGNLVVTTVRMNQIKGRLPCKEFIDLLKLVNTWDSDITKDFLARLQHGYFH
jgi:CRISPR/Cas system Type II protein with McrA/HNH and RuvC-like nuclease domain